VLTSFDHAIVVVRDLEAATRTYARLLGRVPCWRGEHPGAGTANAMIRLENATLELLAPVTEGPVAAALGSWLDDHGEGPLGLAFGTDDAGACRDELLRRGLDPAPVQEGLSRDVESGAFREWRRVALPPDRTRGVVLFAIQYTSPAELLPPSGPLAEEAGCAAALDHAVVMTPDPDAARALYGEGLGLRLALDRSFEEWGARLLFFRIGGVTVELGARLDAAPQADAADRFWGLSYRVPDADSARRRLAGEGFEVSEVRTGRRPGTRVFTVRGPTHGVATLMLERTAPPEG
jgi:catechol 2,3-dioxygenase-like lactoylglutathione lyase family enzyme